MGETEHERVRSMRERVHRASLGDAHAEQSIAPPPSREEPSEEDARKKKKREDDFDAFTSTKSQDLEQPLVPTQIPYKIHIVKDHIMKERLCSKDAYRLQLKLFLDEVKQQQLLLGVRSFLKLFSVITIGKLAQHMGSNETSLREILMAYTHKTHAVDNDGNIISSADFDFCIDEDTIHVTESKSIKHHYGYFLTHILKFEEVIGELGELQVY